MEGAGDKNYINHSITVKKVAMLVYKSE